MDLPRLGLSLGAVAVGLAGAGAAAVCFGVGPKKYTVARSGGATVWAFDEESGSWTRTEEMSVTPRAPSGDPAEEALRETGEASYRFFSKWLGEEEAKKYVLLLVETLRRAREAEAAAEEEALGTAASEV